MSTDLRNRVALVTGAGTGIGSATAIALAREGAAIGIHYHSSATGARQTFHKIEALGGHALLLHADLTVEEQATGIIDQLIQQTGRLDILFNNAGSPVKMVRL